ncbi:hypothetical protein [Photobacterium damselae]|uniref:hypothetical protein n=1 Tax=Photobacterium damselae TaxID=38293 RepID=UPI001F27CDED|nr:hypothetical protein [Photobacterium damselae]UKA04454.1 hypothetical protein IHC89_22795 [Photobacterium damselae subsp. damselae]
MSNKNKFTDAILKSICDFKKEITQKDLFVEESLLEPTLAIIFLFDVKKNTRTTIIVDNSKNSIENREVSTTIFTNEYDFDKGEADDSTNPQTPDEAYTLEKFLINAVF